MKKDNGFNIGRYFTKLTYVVGVYVFIDLPVRDICTWFFLSFFRNIYVNDSCFTTGLFPDVRLDRPTVLARLGLRYCAKAFPRVWGSCHWPSQACTRGAAAPSTLYGLKDQTRSMAFIGFQPFKATSDHFRSRVKCGRCATFFYMYIDF